MVTEITTNEVPAGIRAVKFAFTTKQGACSVVFDRYSTDYATFSSLPQMTSNAIHSVIASGREIIDFKTYAIG